MKPPSRLELAVVIPMAAVIYAPDEMAPALAVAGLLILGRILWPPSTPSRAPAVVVRPLTRYEQETRHTGHRGRPWGRDPR